MVPPGNSRYDLDAPELVGPVMLKNRISIIYLERGYLEADSHSLLWRTSEGEIRIPSRMSTVIMLEPGSVVTHRGVAACAEHGVHLIWVGEAGVRTYATNSVELAKPDRVLRQAQIILDPAQRLVAGRRLFKIMFGEDSPPIRAIEQLRGLEGSRVRKIYQDLANAHGIQWSGRTVSGRLDPPNQAISYANSCLYAVTEAAILAMGYLPCLGIVHSGDARSLTFDIADTIKFVTVTPLAFKIASESSDDIPGRMRRACRSLFREHRLIERLMTIIEQVLGGNQ